MKFGISTWLWSPRFTMDELHLIQKVVDLGFDWIEIPLQDIDQFDYARVGTIARDYGLGVSFTAVLREDRDLTVDDPIRNRAALEYLRHSINAITQMGGNLIGGGIYGGVGRTWHATPDQRKQEYERAAKFLRGIGEYAADQGVVLGIETLVRFRHSFANTIADALELATLVDHPAIQVMADTFPMNVEEKNVADAIEQIGNRLIHVHANENDRGTPGSGHMDWQGIRSALKKINYNGALVIESMGIELRVSADKSLEAIQDEIAVEGCRFLKQFFAR
ncbi:MAG: sugar phosphate isomerase/epimerase [Chloroflexi bacterium]|nr:sugar phosphate isomerase/epimerase [Chloroflexota bacterium]